MANRARYSKLIPKMAFTLLTLNVVGLAHIAGDFPRFHPWASDFSPTLVLQLRVAVGILAIFLGVVLPDVLSRRNGSGPVLYTTRLKLYLVGPFLGTLLAVFDGDTLMADLLGGLAIFLALVS